MTSIEADVAFAPEAARVQAVSARGTRGRRQHPLTQIRRPLSGSWRAVLGAVGVSRLVVLWLGIGESPKITMIVIGTVFFTILMIADVARLVPRELLNASYTLGATRWTVLRRVVFRHSLPGIVDVARVNLAAAWLMLVVSEVLAA